MNLQDWVFALHLVAAAALVGGLVMSWIVVVALRMTVDPEETLGLGRVAMVATIAIAIALPAVIGLGVWLATLRPQLRPWHGWAIAAIVLWAIAAAAVSRSIVEYAKSTRMARELVASGQRGPSAELRALNRTATGLLFRAVASLAVVLIVIDMIYKPGA
jgi:hypothetical protein